MPLIHLVAILMTLPLLLATQPLEAALRDSDIRHNDIRQSITITIEPEKQQIVFQMTLQLSDEIRQQPLSLWLATDNLQASAGELQASGFDRQQRAFGYQLQAVAGQPLTLTYSLPLSTADFSSPVMPSAHLSADFFYLDAAIDWYPRFAQASQVISLQVNAPPGWAVNSGVPAVQRNDGTFEFAPADYPETLYLLGGRYHVYQQQAGDVLVEIYLLQDDAKLAESYLSASLEYLAHYSKLIGAYPYARFSIIENHWQTGFAVPSMTMLGSRVIRLPFIRTTSLPHEILHNWWGNGVFIDASLGNWSEGLTAYMADHANSEERGEGRDYRLKALSRYSSFAAGDNDFALAKFRSRHDESSQAVGYSKSLMLFHMLRMQLGDEAFYAGLREFWETYRFRKAAFDDLLDILLAPLDWDVERFTADWLTQAGAAQLRIDEVTARREADTYRVTLQLSQQQPARRLQVPVHVTLADGSSVIHYLQLHGQQAVQSWQFMQKPLSLAVDPQYDLPRRLQSAEIPPSLGKLLAADDVVLIYPAQAGDAISSAWQNLAAAWSRRFAAIRPLDSDQAAGLSPATPRWIVGSDNSLLDSLENAPPLNNDAVSVLVSEDSQGRLSGFILADDVDMINQLARRLPHYKSYGRLLFDRKSGTNLLKTSAVSARPHPLERSFKW